MKETVQEYVQRIQGKLAGQDPLKVQSTAAKKLARLIKGAKPAKLRKRPAPDTTPSVTRANPSSNSASCVKRIWLYTKCSGPSSGSILVYMPSAVKNPSNASYK